MAYRPRILVVEDEPLSQDMLVRRMASRGFRVATVSDGAAAITHVARELPDLVLLDINMPGISGLEVLRELRKTYKRDALPIILVTAMADSEDVVRGLDAGANDYVVKPINFAVLLARVQVHLRIKLDVSLLIEAERQRVLIAALGEACHQLAQPMTAVMMTLEAMIRHPTENNQEMADSLKDVLRWAEEVGQVIHKMQNVATLRPVPYTERMEFFDEAAATAPVSATQQVSQPQVAQGAS
jgi:DNA-binding response OmpR family regulator